MANYINISDKIKAWTRYVPFEDQARIQVSNIASLPIIFKHVAIMPDVHLGKGATVGSVIPTKKAIIPSAVGVDIGCGMMAVRTNINSTHLPENLHSLRTAIENAIPVGFGKWDETNMPKIAVTKWQRELLADYKVILQRHPKLGINKKTQQRSVNDFYHLGTLGGGNHFIEISLDEVGAVWFILHSGSRGIGNCIGQYFIELAKQDMHDQLGSLPDKELAYFKEGSPHFDDYFFALNWAQRYARANRDVMMDILIGVVSKYLNLNISCDVYAVNCHHNYVSVESHFGEEIFVTRKGAVSAKKNELGIIPGSMGAKTFIVRGLGNKESFCSCSHGAGRIMSRNQAKKIISLSEHKIATTGVECRKDKLVLDESPRAYKNIDDVMKSQEDLVEILFTLKQVLCVKG